MKEKIAVIGSYAVGMTIVGGHFPAPGETVPGRNFQMTHGGKGSNQAVAAARMGAEVVYGTCTGVGLIFVNENGENEIIIDFAANREYSRRDIDAMMPVIRQCKLVLMQLECSMDIVEYTAECCAKEGIPFVLNPAPYSPLKDGLLEKCTYLQGRSWGWLLMRLWRTKRWLKGYTQRGSRMW